MARGNCDRTVCDPGVKSLLRIAASQRQIRIEFQKQTVDLLVVLSLRAVDQGEDADHSGSAEQTTERRVPTALVAYRGSSI